MEEVKSRAPYFASPVTAEGANQEIGVPNALFSFAAQASAALPFPAAKRC
jgi:hypothetical protein